MADHHEPTTRSQRGAGSSVNNDESVRPLAAIRDKERALAQEIRAAQERADARVAEARARAVVIKEQAERDGVREAETLLQEGLARARAEAESIRAEGETNAASLREAGRTRVAEAVEYIVSFVLPHLEK